MINRWFLLSLTSHLIIILTLFISFDIVRDNKVKPEIVDINFKENNGSDSKKTKGSKDNTTPGKTGSPESIERLGSDSYNQIPRSIGERIAADHYLERLRAHIEPNWVRILQREIRFHGNKVRPCLVSLNIDADVNGTILKIEIIKSCGWKIAEDSAINALNTSGLLPPPVDFLINGILYLYWTFEIKEK